MLNAAATPADGALSTEDGKVFAGSGRPTDQSDEGSQMVDARSPLIHVGSINHGIKALYFREFSDSVGYEALAESGRERVHLREALSRASASASAAPKASAVHGTCMSAKLKTMWSSSPVP